VRGGSESECASESCRMISLFFYRPGVTKVSRVNTWYPTVLLLRVELYCMRPRCCLLHAACRESAKESSVSAGKGGTQEDVGAGSRRHI
jgi:hypothetical protein